MRLSRVLFALSLCLTLAAASHPASAQPASGGGPYDRWLRGHWVRAEVTLVLTYDGRALRYREVLRGPDLERGLGVERLVGEEVSLEVSGEGLRDAAAGLGLGAEGLARLRSGEAVEVYAGTYEGACTTTIDPWYTQYPYPQYSWIRYSGSREGWPYYCTADPINLVWYRGDGLGFTSPLPIVLELNQHGWSPTYLQDTNYVYDPVWGWEGQWKSRDKEYPTGDYDRYHVRLWLVHRCGYGRVDVIGQAHVDKGLPHRAVRYEYAESEVREAFRYPILYNWEIVRLIWLGNRVGSPGDERYSDGWATEIAYLG